MIRRLALFLILPSFPLLAELTIRGGGDRIVGLPVPNCSYTMYSPTVLVDPQPAIPGRDLVMYTAGGVLAEACTGVDFMSPARFGDEIWYHYRDENRVWRDADGDPATVDAPILDRSSFAWMNDAEYLQNRLSAYVGHLSSPSVVKIGSRYFMMFVASINDPNLCAGEHFTAGTACGSCTERWSYFVAMWAVSEDGLHWRVFEGSPKFTSSSRAINAAVLWMLPFTPDIDFPQSNFKGVSRTSMIVREEEGQTYFYIAANFWGRSHLKTGMFRIPYDPESEWGWSQDPQAWDSSSGSWRRCVKGQVPRFFNDSTMRGNLFGAFFGNLSETSGFPGYRYIATLADSSGYSMHTAGNGMSNRIAYQLSDDLVHWTLPEWVESRIPFFADGTSYDLSVSDPFYLEEGGLFHLFFASADGDKQAGIERDGIHDCNPDSYPEIPTAPFIGMGIYVGRGTLHSRPTLEQPRPEP